MAIDKKINYNKPIVQGGVDNYLGKQPQVQAPRKWQSSPDKPATELAYITEAEKDLILKSNIHGGLEGGPNMGPSGIMSLDSFGDVGGGGASGGDTSTGGGAKSGAGTGGGGFSGQGGGESPADFKARVAKETAVLQNAENIQARDLGYKARENIANATYGPLQKHTGERGFLGNLFRGANKYGYTDTYTKGPNQGQVKPGWGGRAVGGLGSLLTGIPFVGGALGTAYDYGKGILGRKPRDMSLFNKYGLGGSKDYLPKGTLDFDPNAQIQATSFEQNLPENIKALNTYNDMIPGLETEFFNQDQPGPWNNFTPGGIMDIDTETTEELLPEYDPFAPGDEEEMKNPFSAKFATHPATGESVHDKGPGRSLEWLSGLPDDIGFPQTFVRDYDKRNEPYPFINYHPDDEEIAIMRGYES